MSNYLTRLTKRHFNFFRDFEEMAARLRSVHKHLIEACLKNVRKQIENYSPPEMDFWINWMQRTKVVLESGPRLGGLWNPLLEFRPVLCCMSLASPWFAIIYMIKITLLTINLLKIHGWVVVFVCNIYFLPSENMHVSLWSNYSVTLTRFMIIFCIQITLIVNINYIMNTL